MVRKNKKKLSFIKKIAKFQGICGLYFSEFSKLNDGFCFYCNSELQLFDEIVSFNRFI